MEENVQYGDNRTLAITSVHGRYSKTVTIPLPAGAAAALIDALRSGKAEVEGDRAVRIRIGILAASGTY